MPPRDGGEGSIEASSWFQVVSVPPRSSTATPNGRASKTPRISVAYPRKASQDGAVESAVGRDFGRLEASLDCSESAIGSVCECLEVTSPTSLWAEPAAAWWET